MTEGEGNLARRINNPLDVLLDATDRTILEYEGIHGKRSGFLN